MITREEIDNLINKKIIVSFLTIVLFLSLGVYSYYFFSNKAEDNSDVNKEEALQEEETLNTGLDTDKPSDSEPQSKNESMIGPYTVKKNKYYIVYIKQNNGSGSSFIPLKLNPKFRNEEDYHVSISFDDDGNITNPDKIIVIDNFLISKKNKETIKAIAGTGKYNEALKEIEERVNDTKKNLEKEGLL